MQILKFPDPILFEKCAEVTVFGPELKILLDAMYDLMKKSNGIGLAANQVGMKLRMFVMEGPDAKPIYLVNPKLTSLSKYPSTLKEGCLSAPGEFLSLKRPTWATVSFQDETGTNKSLQLAGIWAICVQHEIDHLDGISFLENKNITKVDRKALAKKWKIK